MSETTRGGACARWVSHYQEIRSGGKEVTRRKARWALRRLLPYMPKALMDRRRVRTAYLPNRAPVSVRDVPHLEGLVVFTPVWGPMVELFDRCLMRSLFSENNLPALISRGLLVELRVYTRQSDVQRIEACLKRHADTLDAHYRARLSFNITPYIHDMDLTARSLGDCLSKCNADQGFLMALPDFFFGDSTVCNLVGAGMGRDSCLAAVHMRVNDDHFGELIKERQSAISNEELVSLALVSAHQNWSESFADRPNNLCHVSGVSVQPLPNGILLVTHHLPTVFFLRVRDSDVEYFRRSDYHAWDHEWPSILISERRYKFIGSSDAVFVVELTGRNSHLITFSGEHANDRYLGSHQLLHHSVNEAFMAVLRPSGFPKEMRSIAY